jgi:hypothetical protein
MFAADIRSHGRRLPQFSDESPHDGANDRKFLASWFLREQKRSNGAIGLLDKRKGACMLAGNRHVAPPSSPAAQPPQAPASRPVDPMPEQTLTKISEQLDQLLVRLAALPQLQLPAPSPTRLQKVTPFLQALATVLTVGGILVAAVRGIAFKDDVKEVKESVVALTRSVDGQFSDLNRKIDPLLRDMASIKTSSDSSAESLKAIQNALLNGKLKATP